MEAHAQCGADIVLVGREEAIRACLTGPLPEGVEIVNATEVVDMCDDPATAFKRKKNSSPDRGPDHAEKRGGRRLRLRRFHRRAAGGGHPAGEADPGVRRAAMGPVLPHRYGPRPALRLRRQRRLYAGISAAICVSGQFYAQRLMGVEKPRVGLLNIGAEPSKGDTLRHETYALLEEAGREGRLNFIGNIEANTALLGGADVIVADGYSGNILLKTVEGAAKLLLGEMKKAFLSSTKSKLGALLVKDSLGDVKKLLDPSEVGGTPFLGISKPVLKAHGSSDARAIRNAVFRAVEYAQSGIIADVEAHIDVMKVEKNG